MQARMRHPIHQGVISFCRSDVGCFALLSITFCLFVLGDEEGSFGWLTANYLGGTFDISPGDSPRPSVGAMDLGGASTQITFQPSSDILAGYFPIYLGLKEQVQYDLYTHSFLRFGQDQARLRLYQKTIEDVRDGARDFSARFACVSFDARASACGWLLLPAKNSLFQGELCMG